MPSVKSVTFRNPGMGWDIAGDFYYPEGFDESNQYPVIVCAHPIGSCKEQTAGEIYAKAMAEAGFIGFAFDASTQGDSGGSPRYVEDPARRVEDFKDVMDYLTTLPYVDADKIGVIGICGGGGYAVHASMGDHRYKAVVGITPINFGRMLRAMAKGDPASMLGPISTQRTAEAAGAEFLVTSLLGPSVEAAKESGVDELDLLEAHEYYRSARGQKPHGVSKWSTSRLAPAVLFDAFHLSDVFLTQPLLCVVGSKRGAFGAYDDAHEVVGKAASKQKEVVVVPDASHYDLYDRPFAVDAAINKVVPFFKTHLA